MLTQLSTVKTQALILSISHPYFGTRHAGTLPWLKTRSVAMNWSVFMRFANLDVLKGISQNLLTRFLEPFTADFAAQGISLPDPNLPEDAYFQAVATLFASPEILPHRLTEALHAVQEMSDPQCRDQINTALAALQFSTPSLPVLHIR